ncbi:bifunctional biotin--[acetyl-CoA-carboxylase] ligase/biotin operon repressor BirA [Shewanella intestini]|uniref:Bifunctional ligase/repressor BirA n=1 Tax=Shewanella intestini TaxID=2017544 RepID=A0ABS5I3Q0_9GAMM|nr:MULTISPECIES: bifunctional biotin--[acetyl-CoA-carboxylase] ligase/biotin operon repressor BirA [Shewanella]MBR9728651.1 bifunctional biotin--[acetyl-CoA-carboxylase] ligase/biotin operon repressor BirA [Shewanella intestini]MRG37293.1 bifunctional biotin--[acetyl-CoA-carboxylase] ligase/biotin operon repressor BirA [Shewanella sp. XMDDZSB0408]
MTMQHWATKRDILALLTADKFVSGEQIATALGLTRGAVNQHIDAMAQYGIDIYSVKGKGYQLAEPISLIDESRLLTLIDKRCFYFDDIDSTNGFLMAHAAELNSGDVCIAEYQSKGRGRRGRTWQSPYGHHLYTSVFWRTSLTPPQLMGLSLVIGCSMVQVLKAFGVDGLSVKWPNDIYRDGRKLAGVLVELGANQAQGLELVIGLGLNMNMSKAQGLKIDQPWSDLSGVENQIDKTMLMGQLHQQICEDIEHFERTGLVDFIARWNQDDQFMGKAVTLIMAPNEVYGTYCGIDKDGAVMLNTAQGKQSYIGGEISLRAD